MSNVYPSQARTYHAEVLPDSPYHSPHDGPPARSGGNRLLWFILGCGGMLLLLCCGGFGTAGFVGYRILAAEKPGIDAELGSFFTRMSNKHYGSAYERLSTTAQRRQSKEQFLAAVNTPWGQAFEEYESYQTTSFNVLFGKPVAPGEPPATTANVNGTVRFKDGRTGSFTALLEKQGEEWRIVGINGSAPPAAK